MQHVRVDIDEHHFAKNKTTGAGIQTALAAPAAYSTAKIKRRNTFTIDLTEHARRTRTNSNGAARVAEKTPTDEVGAGLLRLLQDLVPKKSRSAALRTHKMGYFKYQHPRREQSILYGCGCVPNRHTGEHGGAPRGN